MRKNVASQVVGAQLVSATDGSAFTGSVTCYVTGDAGTQAAGSVGSGACTHEGNGFHTYAPAQAETNYSHVAFTFTGTGAVPATVQVYTSFPQTGDSFALIGSTGSGLTSLATQASVTTIDDFLDTEVAAILAAVDTEVGAIKTITDQITFGTANRVNAQIYGIEANAITAASIAADAITDAKVAADVTIASVTGAVGSVTGAVGSVTGNVGGNVTGSVGSVAAGGITAASIATGAIDADALAADAGTEIAAAVWGADATSYQTQGTFGQAIGDPGADTDTIWAIVNAQGATGAGLSAVPWNASWDAEVQSEVQDAIEVNHLDHLLAVDYDPASKPGTATALLNELVESDAGVSRFTANALEQAPSGTGASAASIADAVWDEVLSDHLTAGTTGAGLNAAGSAGDPWSTALPGAYGAGTAGKLIGDNINATISSRASQTSVDTVDDFLDTEIAAIKAKTDNLPAAPAAVGDIPSAATIADAVLDEAMAGHVSAGSLGKAVADVLDDTGTAGVVVASLAANSVTAAAVAADAVTEIQSGLATAAALSTVAGYLDTEIAAILADTNELQTDLANGGRLDLLIDAIKAKTDLTLTAAQVNAEVVDALNVDTYAEPGQEAPGATVPLAKKVGYLYKLARNKVTQDATTFKLYADDGSTVDQKAAVSDDGTTTTRGELGTGP